MIDEKQNILNKRMKNKHQVESDGLENIKADIEIHRNILNKKISEGKGDLVSTEILELSQNLDDLILKYITLANSLT